MIGERRKPMARHELQTDPDGFDAIYAGGKTFELRKDDRHFAVGDWLRLRETVYPVREMAFGKPLEYTGRDTFRRISYILRGPIYGLAEGWVILAFEG